MRSDVAGADDERGFAVGLMTRPASCHAAFGLPSGVDVQVFHDGPHHGEHVFGHALSVGAGGVGEHGAGVEHARPLVFVDAGAPGLQPFESGALRACFGRDVADDRGCIRFEFVRYFGGPVHGASLCRVADEFLRHAFCGACELRTFGFGQRQAVDDQFAVVPYSIRVLPYGNRSDMMGFTVGFGQDREFVGGQG